MKCFFISSFHSFGLRNKREFHFSKINKNKMETNLKNLTLEAKEMEETSSELQNREQNESYKPIGTVSYSHPIQELQNRKILTFEKYNKSSSSKTFSICSYNVLAQVYVRQIYFPYAKHINLTQKYRRENLMKEMKNLNADIFCLQVFFKEKNFHLLINFLKF